MLERALHTLWQALLAAGVVIPAFSDSAAWQDLLGAVVAALIAAAASLLKGYAKEKLAR